MQRKDAMEKQWTSRGRKNVATQNEEQEIPSVMTVQEVADYLRLSKDSVYKLVKKGELPAAMILNKLRFDRTTVEEYFKQKENNKTK